MLPLIMLGGAAIMGGLSAAQASQQNQAIKRAAKENQKYVNKQITQSRLGFLDDSGLASRQAQSAIGKARNRFGFDSGSSITQFLAAQTAQIEADQAIREINQTNQEEAFASQKQAIASQARTNSQSVGLSAVQGGIQGAQLGLSVGAAINQYTAGINEANARLDFAKAVNEYQDSKFGLGETMLSNMQSSPFVAGSQGMYPDTFMRISSGVANNPLLRYIRR